MDTNIRKASLKKKCVIVPVSSCDQLIVIKPCEKHTVGFKICLPYVLSHLFASTLCSAITQLHVLSECNTNLRIKKTMADMGIHLALKFQVKLKEEDPIDKINPHELGSDQYKLDKLFADRKFLEDVLYNTCIDMIANRCFNSLKTTNMEHVALNLYRTNLVEEEANNKIAHRELSRQVRQQRNYMKTVLYDTNQTVEHLKCKVEDKEMYSKIRSRYVENWQQARTEQHELKILEAESGPSDNINYYQARGDQEQRIHSEVELLVNISINETLMKVEEWMNKFDKDMETQDLKIAKIKNKYKNALDKRIQLEETYATHKTLMQDWIQFKEDRRKANEYRNNLINSAIIVQSWWRGLLVRLQIGPYKPSRRPKKVSANKDKKQK